jgi:hypothetical protein
MDLKRLARLAEEPAQGLSVQTVTLHLSLSAKASGQEAQGTAVVSSRQSCSCLSFFAFLLLQNCIQDRKVTQLKCDLTSKISPE